MTLRQTASDRRKPPPARDPEAGETVPLPGGRAGGMFASLRHRNYRLFFFGQFVSLCGTWMQGIAQPWLVYDLTKSKLLLGLVAATNTFPALIFSFAGGVTADRYPKRRVLLFTQTAMMATALVFWALIVTNLIAIKWIFVLAFISGVAFAFDVPARQAFVIEMVGKEDLMNAIALNSSTFNAARVIGPAIGGIVIGGLGVATCFLLNGLSFVAVLAALLLMRVPPRAAIGLSGSILRDIIEGLNYARRHPVIRATLLLIALSTFFGAPYYVLLPVFAGDVFRVGPAGYGFMMAASGIGALTGALGLAKLGNFPRKGALILGGVIVFAAAIEAFCWSHSFHFAIFFLVIAGSAMTLYGSTCNTLLQTTVPDVLRGRIMALFSLGFIGLAPFGSFQAGVMAHYFGVHIAVGLGVAIMGASGLLILLTMPKMRKA